MPPEKTRTRRPVLAPVAAWAVRGVAALLSLEPARRHGTPDGLVGSLESQVRLRSSLAAPQSRRSQDNGGPGPWHLLSVVGRRRRARPVGRRGAGPLHFLSAYFHGKPWALSSSFLVEACSPPGGVASPGRCCRKSGWRQKDLEEIKPHNNSSGHSFGAGVLGAVVSKLQVR